jgi:hypothetical protein
MGKRTMALGALVVTATLSLAPAQAWAHDDPTQPGTPGPELGAHDPDPRNRPVSAAVAERNDVDLVAKTFGWPVDKTAAHLKASRAFAALGQKLSAKFPNAYAGAVFAEAPGGTSVLRFVGTVPAEATRLAKATGLAVDLKGGAKYSERALRNRSLQVHSELRKLGYTEVVTATTVDDGVVATVAGPGKEMVLPSALRAGVKVERAPERAVTDEHTRGGGILRDDGVFECTSGFAVTTPGGTTGYAGAGHCDGINQYRQPEDGLTYAVVHQAQHVGTFGDFEWKTSSHIEPAEFFARNAEIRDVTSVTPAFSLPVNTPSCVYGRSSNLRACDQVFSTFVTATTAAGTASSLYAMDGDHTIGGDSGGPWSFATIADGIHKGDIFLSGATRNMWSQVGLLPSALGVSVRTK